MNESFDGRLITPADSDWESEVFSGVFNSRHPARRPDAVLRARSVRDVQLGVRLARAKGWTVAVRSGGHSLPVWSVRDGGLLINVRELNEMHYEESTGIVTAGPGTLGGHELFPFLKARGRFFNGGHHPSVGLGGFLLQGGQGWAQRGMGWGAESVVAVDVVTADGDLVRADSETLPDLYWAARGAGPGFPGIVVGFHIRTRPTYGCLAQTVQIYDICEFTDVMTWVYGLHAELASSVELVVEAFTDMNGSTPRRRFLLSGLSFAGDEAEARAALAPLDECPSLDRARTFQRAVPTTIEAQYQLQEEDNPPGAQYISNNIWVDGDIDDVVRRIAPLFADPPTPNSWAVWISNAPVQHLPDMAFSLQTEAIVNVYMVYDDPDDYDRNQSWLDRTMDDAREVVVGQYIGESDQGRRQYRFIADENWDRLGKVIEQWDPEGRFAGYLCDDPEQLNRNYWEAVPG